MSPSFLLLKSTCGGRGRVGGGGGGGDGVVLVDDEYGRLDKLDKTTAA
jgi:hypothetical protein